MAVTSLWHKLGDMFGRKRLYLAMRRIVASTYTTFDGYIDNPRDWSLRCNGEGVLKYSLELTLGADALLLGADGGRSRRGRGRRQPRSGEGRGQCGQCSGPGTE